MWIYLSNRKYGFMPNAKYLLINLDHIESFWGHTQTSNMCICSICMCGLNVGSKANTNTYTANEWCYSHSISSVCVCDVCVPLVIDKWNQAD